MPEFKGTPGPWMLSGKTVYALNGDGYNRFSALIQDAYTKDEELQANAQLIAAAPELLEALQSIEMRLDAYNSIDRDMPVESVFVCLERAQAVIRKALGQ